MLLRSRVAEHAIWHVLFHVLFHVLYMYSSDLDKPTGHYAADTSPPPPRAAKRSQVIVTLIIVTSYILTWTPEQPPFLELAGLSLLCSFCNPSSGLPLWYCARLLLAFVGLCHGCFWPLSRLVLRTAAFGLCWPLSRSWKCELPSYTWPDQID